MKKKLVLLVVVVLTAVLPLSSIAYAVDEDTPVDEEIVTEYKYIEKVDTLLSISNGTAHINLIVKDTDGDTTSISSTATLQKYSNGSWSKVKSWSSSTAGRTLTISKTKAVSHGKYRVKSVTKAYKGNKSETITTYSGTKNY